MGARRPIGPEDQDPTRRRPSAALPTDTSALLTTFKSLAIWLDAGGSGEVSG
jgi:hypothetical protein